MAFARYKNSVTLLLSLVALYFGADTEVFRAVVAHIAHAGYVGAMLMGMLYVSTFTVVPATVVLSQLAETANPMLLALAAGAGAVVGDVVIFRVVKDGVLEELRPVFTRIGSTRAACVLRSPRLQWLVPVLGALLIASPFPDEIGIGLMGLTGIRLWHFVVLSFGLSSIGILMIVTTARLV